jgi:signal transduction histidine kinase
VEQDRLPPGRRRRRRPWEALSGNGSSPSLARRFLLTYGIMLTVATVAIGFWVGQQIEDGVLNRTAAVTAVYIHSFVAPEVQSLTTQPTLDSGEQAALARVLAGTELGQRLVGFRIWSRDGTVVYSPIAQLVGQRFPLIGSRARSFQGAVTVDISDLSDPENVFERQRYSRLVEMYVPILQNGSGEVLAVAEFYQLPDEIDAEVFNARIRSWALVLFAAVASFVLVAAMVLRTSRTIARQETRLRDQVGELSGLLAQVEDLTLRIRHAGAEGVAIYARERRRISADLHDGPGQALALALLQFEDIEAEAGGSAGANGVAAGAAREAHGIAAEAANPAGAANETAATAASSAGAASPASPAGATAGVPLANGKLKAARAAITDALAELREIAADLRLPELAQLTVTEAIERAVRDHARRSGVSAAVETGALPADAPLAVKISLFRALQESLSNATRHGRGIDVRVHAWVEDGFLHLDVSDHGPGFSLARRQPRGGSVPSGGGIGLAGIRERAALVGGTFEIRSAPGEGTTVSLSWPLAEPKGDASEPIVDGSTA